MNWLENHCRIDLGDISEIPLEDVVGFRKDLRWLKVRVWPKSLFRVQLTILPSPIFLYKYWRKFSVNPYKGTPSGDATLHKLTQHLLKPILLFISSRLALRGQTGQLLSDEIKERRTNLAKKKVFFSSRQCKSSESINTITKSKN